MTVMDAAEVLQQLHDSEINVEVSCFFDCGWRWRIGDDLNGWRHEGKAANASEAIRALAETVFAEFPRSAFAAWWREHRPQAGAAPTEARG